MNNYKKIPYPLAATITARYELSEEAECHFTQEMTPFIFSQQLKEQGLWHDLIFFLAHGLPVMNAIAWARSALLLRQNDWSKEELIILQLAEEWLQTPNETIRIRINQLGQRIGLKGAPSWISQAIFWSGSGSIVEPDLPAVLPPPFLYCNAVAAAITIAAVIPEWDGYEGFLKETCTMGEAMAMDNN